MNVIITLFGFVLGAQSLSYAQDFGIEKALESALSWHYRWMEPVPRDIVAIECSIAIFEERSFALCEPVSLAIDIETPAEQPPHVTNIVHDDWSFERALRDFRTHRNPKGQARGPIQRISIPVRNLDACRVDRNRTSQISSIARRELQNLRLEDKGLSFRYPVLCEGDPFYLVYFMKGEQIEWIWKYIVYADRLELTWSFDSDNERRKIPKLAVDNLKKKELWHTVDPQPK